MKLHHRIVVPLALVALAATALSAYVALSAAARALEVRVEAQVTNASALISQSDFALNPAILQSVKAISGVEVITFTPGGLVLASTVPSGQAGPLVGAVTAAGIAAGALADTGHGVARVVRLSCGTPCYVAFRRPPALSDTIVAVVSEASELTAATRAVTRAIVSAAGVSLLLMVLVSQLIARRVTAPIDELVHFASGVAVGDSDRRAAVGTDEVGRLGQAFNDMLDRLERSRQALVRSEKLALAGLIAARVAHDIRNPLSSIKMQTQLLRSALHPGARAAGRRDVDLKSGEMLDGVLRDISQVETVISDLLELARPGVLKKHPVRLDALVREVLLQLAPQLAHRKIRVELHLDDQLPPVPLDTDRFRQALLNVVNNAADAMTTGGTLSVATRRDGWAIALDVCDDGTGIAPDLLERVFEPFVSTKRDGVGLGLVNARAVVESHGGRIEITPRSPKGTRATLRLPIHGQAHG